MKHRSFQISLILLGLASFSYLSYQLFKLPPFVITSSNKKIMILALIIISCLLVGIVLKLMLKKIKFLTLFFIVLVTGSAAGIFYYFTPNYTIIVPENYVGEVNLVLSTLKENQLNLDSNGIGYINKKTFNSTFKPTIIQQGIQINDRAVGLSPSTFWSKLITITSDGKKIETLNFNILPEKDEIPNDNFDLIKSVDYLLIE